MSFHIPTTNLTLARCLTALGVSYRHSDPVTCLIEQRNGKPEKSYTFWFEESPDYTFAKIKELIQAFYSFIKSGEYTLDKEHALYFMIAAIQNGNVYLDWMKRATPFTQKRDGSRILLVPEKPSEDLQRILRNQQL